MVDVVEDELEGTVDVVVDEVVEVVVEEVVVEVVDEVVEEVVDEVVVEVVDEVVVDEVVEEVESGGRVVEVVEVVVVVVVDPTSVVWNGACRPAGVMQNNDNGTGRIGNTIETTAPSIEKFTGSPPVVKNMSGTENSIV